MDESVSWSRELGREIADHHPRPGTLDEAMEEAREQLFEQRRRREPKRTASRLMFLAAAAVLVLIFGGAAGLWHLRSRAMGFEVASNRGAVLKWVEPREGEETPLRFSDGSSVLLEGGSRARVVDVDAQGARFELGRGRAIVSVTHRAASRWVFEAGPYQVLVKGTQFNLAWDARIERFELVMRDGAVQVTGPLLAEPMAIVAGQTLVLQPPAKTASVSEPSSAPMPGFANGTLLAEPDTTGSPDPGAEPGSSQGKGGPASLTWSELARSKRHREAVDAAEAAGFSGICASAGGGDLLLLADSARFAGKGARAAEAYDALIRRFPGSSEAGRATFMLGLMASQSGNRLAALRWFERYLQQYPSGPFTREAMGRLLEAYHAAGDTSGARSVAQRYLATYPSGPHAKLAESVLARP